MGCSRLAAVLLGSLAAGCVEPGAELAAREAEILGGQPAPAGKWPDLAAVNRGGEQFCTGTLVAPTVVITAAHCILSSLDGVMLDATSLDRPEDGEVIAAARIVESERADIGLVVLERAAVTPPRALATGWAAADVQNGDEVTIAGYGAQDESGTVYGPELREAVTTVTDADCLEKEGCEPELAPGGELGAGGMGVDTCYGDSGGPLYRDTGYGTFLAGVTSRSYDDATIDCSQGGIYVRPHKFAAWIEETAGVPVLRGPEPTAAAIVAMRGAGGETQVEPNDPRGGDHTYAIAEQPKHGQAAVRDDGRVRVCPDPTFAGNDVVVVAIGDADDARRVVQLTVPITAQDGGSGECDVDDFEGGGCCGAARGDASWLVFGVLALLRRLRTR